MNGVFRGVVVATDDPEQRGRVRVALPDLLFDPEAGQTIGSPWCEAMGGLGAGAGSFSVPPLGSQAWVHVRASEDGAPWQFAYTHGPHGGSKASHAPPTSRGEDDETSGGLKAGTEFSVPGPSDAPAAPGRPARSDPRTIPGIPPSAQAADYGQNRVFKSPGGVVVELDDTEGAARIHVWHPSGTYLEINDAGVWTERSSKRWAEVADADTSYVGGDARRRVNGHVLESTGGNRVEEGTGRRVIEAREIDLVTRAHMILEAGARYQLGVNGHASQEFRSGLQTAVGGDLTLSCVRGSFVALGGLDATLLGSVGVSTPMMRVFEPALIATLSPVVKYETLLLYLEALLVAIELHTHPVAQDPITQKLSAIASDNWLALAVPLAKAAVALPAATLWST